MTSTARWPSSVSSWRPERAAHELRREEQRKARKCDLQRSLRDVVGEHGAADLAERRHDADRQRVAKSHVAVAVLTPAADDRDQHNRDHRRGLGLVLGLVQEDRERGYEQDAAADAHEAADRAGQEPEEERGELAQPINSLIATATSSAANISDTARPDRRCWRAAPATTPAIAGTPIRMPLPR